MFRFQFLDQIRRELVANSIHTPTRLDLTVESRRRRQWVLGIKCARSECATDERNLESIFTAAAAVALEASIKATRLFHFHY